MSRNIIFVLMYHRHILLDFIYVSLMLVNVLFIGSQMRITFEVTKDGIIVFTLLGAFLSLRL
jgi:hypothetical protein